MQQRRLHSAVLVSIAAALVTLGLKTASYFITGSVGLLSDAVESVVNLTAAVAAYIALRYAARPVDEDHTYGHEKIEFFSSGLEGGLILMAAIGIAWYAVKRLLVPEAPESLGLGMTLSLVAAAINGVVAVYLLRLGRRHQSIVLEADGKHLMTDVWTSAAVLAGLTLVWLTNWEPLDPLIALIVACNILWTAADLVRRSFNGLMDHALPVEEQQRLREAITSHLRPNMTFHALRTRQAGSRRFVDFHLLVPGALSVAEAHAVGNKIEDAVRALFAGLEVTVHIEPIEERGAWEDSELLRVEREAQTPGPTLQ
jgi:cation diffusion facilitator family transporter